eukprot:CAMPEP_0114503400 /NCGR_PEP_ID=MMETSP0109-20121206/9626_1 /TAXON_ID=29199 /ORGANISM="Chlorarachnion reptans, Strain CCCM449" /LENGTH=646 /DNA_ID=CAMNT_0001681423 /DNA_START=18 /DNA_END=1958 /DNA_ORIENTATION=+
MEEDMLEQGRKLEQLDAEEENKADTEGGVNSFAGFGVLSNNAFALAAPAREDEPELDDAQGEREYPTDAFPKKKKKNKKKKKKKGQIDTAGTSSNEKQASKDEDIDSILAEIGGSASKKKKKKKKKNKDVGGGGNENCQDSKTKDGVLKLERNKFDWRGELMHMFGSKAVKGSRTASSDRKKGSNRQKMALRKSDANLKRKRTIVTRPQSEWQNIGRRGGNINMVFRHVKEGKSVFSFCWDLEYGVVEQDFQACKNSMDPRAIAMFHQMNPFHAGGNLQMAEIYLHRGDFKIASDLIERAVYIYERGYHAKFDPLKYPTQCRLQNQREEDREYMKALRRHAQCLGRRGCVRAALETYKYALSLCPEEDPLCLLSTIGFYALRAKEYKWLIDFVDNFTLFPIPARYFPNLLFNGALARRNLKQNEEADELLETAIRVFPTTVLALINGIDSKLVKNDQGWKFLKKWPKTTKFPFINKLIQIFASRSAALWRSPQNLAWLRETSYRIHKSMKTEGKNEDCDDKYVENSGRRSEEKKLILAAFGNVNAPIAYRELQKADYTDEMPQLPAEYFQQHAEQRPQMPQNPATAGEGETIHGNPLTMFFRSMMPGFNPDAVAAESREALLVALQEEAREAQLANENKGDDEGKH